MATNESRSLNTSLDEGATDGKYRKVRPNTTVASGTGDELMRANRRGLHPYWNYGFADTESVSKVNPLKSSASAGRSQQYGTPVAAIEAATQQYN